MKNVVETRVDVTVTPTPEHCWSLYSQLKADSALQERLNSDQLEALARLVREISLNECHHGIAIEDGLLSIDMESLEIELSIPGDPFNSVREAVLRNEGGLWSTGEMLKDCGATWEYCRAGGKNIQSVRFSGSDLNQT